MATGLPGTRGRRGRVLIWRGVAGAATAAVFGGLALARRNRSTTQPMWSVSRDGRARPVRPLPAASVSPPAPAPSPARGGRRAPPTGRTPRAAGPETDARHSSSPGPGSRSWAALSCLGVSPGRLGSPASTGLRRPAASPDGSKKTACATNADCNEGRSSQRQDLRPGVLASALGFRQAACSGRRQRPVLGRQRQRPGRRHRAVACPPDPGDAPRRPPRRSRRRASTPAKALAARCMATGKVECWGDNTYGQLGRGRARAPGAADLAPGNAIDFGVGRAGACAVLADGRVKCWGTTIRAARHRRHDNRGDQDGEMGDNLPAVDLGTGRTARRHRRGRRPHLRAARRRPASSAGATTATGELGLGDTSSARRRADEMGDEPPRRRPRHRPHRRGRRPPASYTRARCSTTAR